MLRLARILEVADAVGHLPDVGWHGNMREKIKNFFQSFYWVIELALMILGDETTWGLFVIQRS